MRYARLAPGLASMLQRGRFSSRRHGTCSLGPPEQRYRFTTTMTLEATPIQPAPDAGALIPLPGDVTDRTAHDGSPSPSRLSYCIAWLFGLEALLRDADERDGWQGWD